MDAGAEIRDEEKARHLLLVVDIHRHDVSGKLHVGIVQLGNGTERSLLLHLEHALVLDHGRFAERVHLVLGHELEPVQLARRVLGCECQHGDQ